MSTPGVTVSAADNMMKATNFGSMFLLAM
jgi:hypothetical protein